MLPSRMRPTPLATLVTLVALLLSAGSTALASGPSSSTARLSVKFRAGTSSKAATRALAAVGARELGTIPDLGVHVVQMPSAASAWGLNALAHGSLVAYAERDQ
jgi:hypothetical protein